MPRAQVIRSRADRLVALVAVLLHFGTALITPLLHAQTEVLQSALEVEATHSDQCPRIHAEQTCLTCSTFQLPSAGARVLVGAGGGEPTSPPLAAANPITRHDEISHHPVRAPPSH